MEISQIKKVLQRRKWEIKPSLEKFVETQGFGPYGMLAEEGKPKLEALEDYCQDIVSKIKKSTQKEKLLNQDAVYHTEVYHPNVRKLDGLRILHISDTHFQKSDRQEKKFKSYFSFLDNQEFDLAIHTGDITNSGETNLSDEQLCFLRDINSRLGKYFIFGGHDYFNNNETYKLKEKIEKTGFRDTNNLLIQLQDKGEAFNLIGLDEFQSDFKDFSQGLEQIEKNKFNMLMIHNLDKLTSEFPALFDLVFSGHLHSGELNLGIINGLDYLTMVDDYLNLNRQKKGFKFLTNQTLSYINPGFYTHATEKWGLPRINAEKQGIAILTLKQYNL